MKYVITAAYGGIGSALSRRLAAKGHELMLIGRNGDKLAALCAEVNAQYVVTDLTNLDHVEAGVQSFGPIDGIVNCAGSILLKPAHITTEAEFQQTLDTNLKTAFIALRAGVKNMPTGGGDHADLNRRSKSRRDWARALCRCVLCRSQHSSQLRRPRADRHSPRDPHHR